MAPRRRAAPAGRGCRTEDRRESQRRAPPHNDGDRALSHADRSRTAMKAPAFWWEKPGLWSMLLSPVAAIYGRIAEQRLTQPGARVGIPVICIGNPTIGGAGKTPTAIAIARMLIAAGEKPIFLTRGYGGRLAGPVLVEAAHTAAQVGAEPVLLARVAPTVVAANRVAGAQLAKHEGASVIVMDDGFQNPSLAKDFS